MSTGRVRYLFTTSAVFITFFLIILAWLTVGNFGSGSDMGSGWINSLFGINTDSDDIKPFYIILAVTIIVLGNALILHRLNTTILSIGKEKLFLPVLYTLLLTASPESIAIKGATISSLFVFLSLFYTLSASKDEKNLFLSGLFISIAVIAEPRFFILLLYPLIFSMAGRTFKIRELVILLLSIALPVIALMSFYRIVNGNLEELIESFTGTIFLKDVIKVPENTPVGYLLVILYVILTLWGLFGILRKINRYKIIKAMTLYRLIALLFFVFVIYCFYPSMFTLLTPLSAIPMSVIFAEQLEFRENGNSYRAIFFVYLILLAVRAVYGLIL